MYTTTISHTINIPNADSIKFNLVFTHDDVGIDQSWEANDYSIKMNTWGDMEWSFDIEELLITPGSINCKLDDGQSVLHDYFFGTTASSIATEKRPNLEVDVNNNIKFSGDAVEDQIEYDMGLKQLTLNAQSDLDILNKTMVYDGNTILNPLALTDNNYYMLSDIILKIYQKVNASITLELRQNWEFFGLSESTSPSGLPLYDIRIDELMIDIHDLFFDTSKGISNLGDVLKKLATDWGCYTGLLNKDQAFFKQLFDYDSTNLQTLGKVRSFRKAYRYNLIEFVRITINGIATPFTQGVNGGISDKILERDTLPFFYSDGMSSSSLGNAGSNIMATLNRPGQFYIKTQLPVIGDVYLNNGSNYQVISLVGADIGFWVRFQRISGVNDPSLAFPTLTKVSGTGPDVLNFTISPVGLDGATFTIYRARDNNISTNWLNLGEILALYWYFYRGDQSKCRADYFLVDGIDYNFLKCFTYGTSKYQVLSLKIKPSKLQSEIIALYLGDL